MNAISVKLPSDLHAALDGEARRRNVSRSVLVREIIDDALRGGPSVTPTNCAELAADLVGAVRSGRSDLATNRRFLADAIFRDAQRPADRRR